MSDLLFMLFVFFVFCLFVTFWSMVLIAIGQAIWDVIQDRRWHR